MKWVLERRKNVLDNYCKILDRVLSKITINMEKNNSISSDNDILEKFIIIAGESKHVSTQEPYYYENSYKVFCSGEAIPINDEGQAEIFNIQNEHNDVSWSCNPKQCLLDESILKSLLDVFKYLNSKSAIKVFNLISNESQEFINKIKILCNIKTHFPKIRTIVRELYQLICYCKSINAIDCDLNSVNVDKLCELGVPFDIKNAHCELNMHESELNEDLIIEKYKCAFNSLKKRCNDIPINHCICCQRLLCLRDLSAINKLRNPIQTD